MADSTIQRNVSLSSSLKAAVNPDPMEVSGLPEIAGYSGKVTLARDGTVRVSLSCFASYAGREVSVIEEIPLEATEMDELFVGLLNEHKSRLAQRAFAAASQAMQVALRNGEI